ncbi:cupin domain-containing protein [Paracoccus sp. 11-3]|uniref:Cupin domain-containing protein n=1 Tax=Paracoccus amoyensis TaxID=2760093 RepID=A0A926GHN3_9RHOB|nr:cupin domain-containing protein [Paracoccus amoyensis]MBC9248447.1 cupin domain-containing protein [Paracoccus amoyensis]
MPRYIPLAIACLTAAISPALAQEPASVTQLLQQSLDLDGKEVVMLRVDYAPGGSDPVHRHDADVFVYILEGSVVMQVEGGPEVTLNPGDTFVEGKDDVHLVGRNASDTAPASFLAFFVKDAGAPVLLPVQ